MRIKKLLQVRRFQCHSAGSNQHSFVYSYFPGADNNACISVVAFKGQSSVSRSYYKADCIHNVLYSRYDSCILDSSDGLDCLIQDGR